MPRTRSLLPPAAAAAAALLAGCDYWRNLTEEITPDRAAVTLSVRDALTGEPLAGAACGKPGREAFLADGDGVIARDDVPTGRYDLVCEAPFYRPRTVPFELKLGESKSETIRLVRQGGDAWYPDFDDRQVSIRRQQGNDRYPGTMVFQALPEDDSGRFIYEWTSNLHPSPPASAKPIWSLYTGSGQPPAQTLLVGLRVSFRPKGESQSYFVDSAAFPPLNLVRNLPPVILLDTNFKTQKVGCPDEPNVFNIVYDAYDPNGDGGCTGVRITSADPLAPAGIIDTVVPCGRRAFALEVEPPLGSSTVIRKSSFVKLEVRDENGESDSATFVAESFTNIPPSIKMKLFNMSAYVFTTTLVRCSLHVDDAEGGQVKDVILDWGDGNILPIPMGRIALPFKKAFDYKYDTPGDYRIKATVNDRCGGTDADSQEISVRRNSVPAFRSVVPLDVDRATGEFRLNVEIEDMDTHLDQDTIGLFVQWDLDQRRFDTVYHGEPNQRFLKTIGHRFDPAGQDSVYKIRLQAFDMHEDREDTLIVIPKSEAVLPPPLPLPAPEP